MRELSDSEKQRLLEEVRREFPDDNVMQQVHYVRLVHSLRTNAMTAEDRVRFYQRRGEGAGFAE